MLRILLEAGGKVIDSSPMYGRAEAVVGNLLTEMKAHDRTFLATKVWTSGEAAGIAQMKASAAKLQAPVIDLMQIHNLVDWRTHLRTCAPGRSRRNSATSASPTTPTRRSTSWRPSSAPSASTSCSSPIRSTGAPPKPRLLPLCAERGVAVLVNRPFGSGSLFGQVKGKSLPEWASELDCASWSQFFLKYILGHPAVTCVIPGTAKPEHMRDNVAAGLGNLPDAAQRRRMAEYWESL